MHKPIVCEVCGWQKFDSGYPCANPDCEHPDLWADFGNARVGQTQLMATDLGETFYGSAPGCYRYAKGAGRLLQGNGAQEGD